jgi:hypothetical protein
MIYSLFCLLLVVCYGVRCFAVWAFVACGVRCEVCTSQCAVYGVVCLSEVCGVRLLSDFAAIDNYYTAIAQRFHSDCAAIPRRLRCDCTAIAQRFSSASKAIAHGLRSDSKAIAQRLRRDFAAVVQQFPGDCAVIAQRLRSRCAAGAQRLRNAVAQ